MELRQDLQVEKKRIRLRVR
jgi:hypothetical protein